MIPVERMGRLALAVAVVAASMVLPIGVWQADRASAAGPCDAPVNVIACENSKPGTPSSNWDVNGSGDPSIQGYSTSMSVQPGETVRFKIKTTASSYHFDILRMGYYQGNGARLVAARLRPTATLPQTQPPCLTLTDSTGLIDCGNWAQSASWAVPSTAVSGVYICLLYTSDAADE